MASTREKGEEELFNSTDEITNDKKRPHSPDDDNETEKNGSADVKAPQVHSANSWETVDLGDDDRKAKFLKLMGAGKKEHHGRFIIGDPAKARTNRSSEEVEGLETKLEQQYEHYMADHLKHKNKKHRGLGFADEAAEQQPSNSKDDDAALPTVDSSACFITPTEDDDNS